ncbi:MAG: M20/M25/M40 family metallo-hydrolase [bacterium]|nr:M20/M25/M40 family metallo-hydrolase [bacterium]
MRALAPLLILLAAGVAGAHEADPGAASITQEGLMADVRALCAPELGGRLPGTAGYDEAMRYCSDRFAALGLEAGGDDGWSQRLTMELNQIRSCELTLVGADGVAEPLALGSDFACRGFTGSGVADAPVAFVGYGLSLPGRGHDDYAGLDVRGKIVLAIKPAPKWEPADGEGWGDVHLPRPKSRAARDHGAVGLLLIPHPVATRPQPAIASVLHGPGEQVGDLPQAELTAAAAARLCAGGLLELAGLVAAVDEAKAPASRELPGRARLAVDAAYDPAAPTANVVGILPGTDPELRDECLVIGGHLDHVGRQGEVIWPGANDNASGAASVLALARAFAEGGVLPRRTVVFVLFAGEEQGLNGARWFVTHPARPFERTIAMMNLDCVAHGDSIQLGGGGSQPVLWGLARGLDAAQARLSTSRTWPGGGADAEPFHEAGVPTLYFASTPSYTHLHQATDTPETLNPLLHAELTRLAYRTAVEIVQGRYVGEGETSR